MNTPTTALSARAIVQQFMDREMDMTEANVDEPKAEDYVSDLVRFLNNQLPESQRFFVGD